jgi:hypothetical protein
MIWKIYLILSLLFFFFLSTIYAQEENSVVANVGSIEITTEDFIKQSELNTFTYKLIGFGGRIAAFPVTIPMYEGTTKCRMKKLLYLKRTFNYGDCIT